MILDPPCGKSLFHVARKQKLFQSFSGIDQICAKFPDAGDKDDFKPLNVHRQSCKQQTVKAKED